MSDYIRIRSSGGIPFGEQLLREIEEIGLSPRQVDNIVPGAVEIIVTLGSAGAFTALYKVLSKLLNTNKSRQITIQHKESSISITGHSIMEEKELIKLIAPHLLDEKGAGPEKNKKK